MDHCSAQALGKLVARATSPPLRNFFGGFKNADAPLVLCKISGSMVSHCLPQAYAKRDARPNEPPALDFFEGLKKTDALKNFTKHGWSLLRGARDRTSPLWNCSTRKNADPHVLWKMLGNMVDHCPPQAYAKRRASPNEPSALEFFSRPQKC